MAFFSSSDRTEQLITGRSAPDDLPDESARVAKLLTALRSPMASDGAGEQEAVSTIVAAIAAAPVSLDTARRRRMLPQLLTAKVAAAAAAVLLVGTGAAAATGSLPDAAQSSVSRALSHVDVSIPNPNDHGDDHANDHATGAGDHPQPGNHGAAIGPDATGSAKKGLCTAWAARGKDDTERGNSANSVAFTNLRHTAHDAGMLVKEYCHDVLTVGPKSPNGDSSDPSGDQGQSADHRQNGDQSPAGDHGPAVETPNSGGIDTGASASDGANDGGAGHAAPPASAGSGNDGADHGSSSGPDHPTGRP
jgi:hypothetical protein